MPGALAGEHGPGPAAATAGPGRSLVVLAVKVSDISSPRWARGQADLERRVDTLQAAQDAFVLRPSQAVPDELEKLRSDRAGGGTVVGIACESHVLARLRRTPDLDAVVPVVGDRAQVTRGNVLARFVRELAGDDERGDACSERRR